MIGFLSTFAVSVPKASSTPLPFATMFEDDFDGSSIDTRKWNTSLETSGNRWCSDTVEFHHSNPGNWLDPEKETCHGLLQSSPFGAVSVDGGKASFSASPLRTFPYIWRGPPSKLSPFPATGDFVLEVRMKFDEVRPYGDGLAVVPWANSDPVGNNPPIPQAYEGMILLIWADAGGLSVRTVGNTFRPLSGALDFHLYRLENVGGSYSLFVDNSLVVEPIFSNMRPYTLWIGNPVFVHWEVLDWSDFSVDYIRVSVPATLMIVDVDVKPGSEINRINVRSVGVIPVAVLTDPDFSADRIDLSTVTFGRAGTEAIPVQSALDDVDLDGDMDMVMTFRTQDTGLQAGDNLARLVGVTLEGRPFEGSDSVIVFLPADVNGDLLVNVLDLALVGSAYGFDSGSSGYKLNADFNDDGVIDIIDLATVGQYFGRHA